ncbi:MAG: zeta toxin [Bacteroidia bacterium]|nr:zeta toxin [Bacteroidia bacterium]
MPNLYIIAGCNGAGKTTVAFTVLPEILQCKEFVNADEIARGLSPFMPESVAIQAGRIMLTRIRSLIDQRVDFAFETTLSTRSYLPLIAEARRSGYVVTLFFIWLNDVELAMDRVKLRVLRGGHLIREVVIRRRYQRGLQNFDEFQKTCDAWMVADNSHNDPAVVAIGRRDIEDSIINADIWNTFLHATGKKTS